jgi:hypothetical protein
MIYVLAFVVLLLAAAVIALFAMLGELYARLGGAKGPTPTLDEAKVGQQPAAWPKELSRVATAPDGLLMVLSTSCASCARVADQLRDRADPLPGYDTAVALSTPDQATADAFVAEHGLRPRSTFIDVRGKWVTGEFGVQTSPSALFLRGGRLDSALVFMDVDSLRDAAVPAGQHD